MNHGASAVNFPERPVVGNLVARVSAGQAVCGYASSRPLRGVRCKASCRYFRPGLVVGSGTGWYACPLKQIPVTRDMGNQTDWPGASRFAGHAYCLWVDCRATLRRVINGGGNGRWKPGTSHSKHLEAQPVSGRPASWAGPMASAPLGVLSRIDDLPCSQHDYLSQRVHAFSA